MKNKINFLKSRFLEITSITVVAILVLTLTMPSSNYSQAEDTKAVAQDHNNSKFNNGKEEDAEFLVSAAEINLEQIQMGQLARIRGITTYVKELGKLIETENTKALESLQALAVKKQIEIPATITDNGIDANKNLIGTKASNFDKEYADMMVNGDKDAISKFEKASTDAQDIEIRDWATAMLPALRTHLDHSIKCQKECEKM